MERDKKIEGKKNKKVDTGIITFLKALMFRRNTCSSRLAHELGVSHATVSRWLSGKDVPNMRSSRRLAEYTGIPLHDILAVIGYLPRVAEEVPSRWPEFREYARQKYPAELDEDLITLIEDLIERRRAKKYNAKRGTAGSMAG